MAKNKQYSGWIRVCRVPGRLVCFDEGQCEGCTWADKFEHPEKYPSP
jgi:hypothetical protein